MNSTRAHSTKRAFPSRSTHDPQLQPAPRLDLITRPRDARPRSEAAVSLADGTGSAPAGDIPDAAALLESPAASRAFPTRAAPPPAESPPVAPPGPHAEPAPPPTPPDPLPELTQPRSQPPVVSSPSIVSYFNSLSRDPLHVPTSVTYALRRRDVARPSINIGINPSKTQPGSGISCSIV